MSVDRITGQGLSAIALSVALLWGCLFVEHNIMRNADAQYSRIVRELQFLKPVKRPNPVPVQFRMRAPRPHAIASLG